jgi:hypothetical protein
VPASIWLERATYSESPFPKNSLSELRPLPFYPIQVCLAAPLFRFVSTAVACLSWRAFVLLCAAARAVPGIRPIFRIQHHPARHPGPGGLVALARRGAASTDHGAAARLQGRTVTTPARVSPRRCDPADTRTCPAAGACTAISSGKSCASCRSGSSAWLTCSEDRCSLAPSFQCSRPHPNMPMSWRLSRWVLCPVAKPFPVLWLV